MLNPLTKARDRTGILMDSSQTCFHCATKGTPTFWLYLKPLFKTCRNSIDPLSEAISFCVCLFRATPLAYGDSQARGLVGAAAAGHCHTQQLRIQAASVTYTTAHGNAASLTHWARPEIEPTSSWMLVRFVNCWATTGTPQVSSFKGTNLFMKAPSPWPHYLPKVLPPNTITLRVRVSILKGHKHSVHTITLEKNFQETCPVVTNYET